ncbi:unnamed protein product [Paramecium octaurelia]|uniref:Ubiquitin-like domain-containing protein n=1 Tax=Paramecium octaurelia TaxID=43137 RepID=A0A8S1WXW6_PAROT|nr:unnamed protein product [Paramecium octaurelia]
MSMKKYEIIVNNNTFKLEYEPKFPSEKISDVVQFLNQQKGFPAKAKLYISVDNHIRDLNYDLNSVKNNVIEINFSDVIENFSIQHIDKDEKYKLILDKVDICKQLIEIEKKIANSIKSEEYPIKILKKKKILDRNLFLCQIFFYQQEIFYFVQAIFYIRYNDKLQLFQIDAFSHFDKIKQKIRQKLGIEEEIELYFRGQQLEDERTYFYYNIHQNAELELKMKNMQRIQISYQNKIYKFNVSVNMTIEQLAKYYKQLEQIHQNQILQVHHLNKLLENNTKIGNLDLSDNAEFKITNKIQERAMVIKFVSKLQEQVHFQKQVSNLDFFSTILESQIFKGKVFQFYVNGNILEITDGLIFNSIKFKENEYLIQYQMIQNFEYLNVTFKDEEGKTFTKQVKSEDTINTELEMNIKYDNLRIKAYKKGQLIDLNGTYRSEGIQDGDIIEYCLSDMVIQLQIWYQNQRQIQEICIHYLDTVKELKEKVINQFKITYECKIILDGYDLQDYEYIKNYRNNVVFTVSKAFYFKIELLLDNNIEQSESRFYETEKVKELKSQYTELFQDDVCVDVDDNEDIKDEEELSAFIGKVLRISKRNVNVKYKFQGHQSVYEDKFYKKDTLGMMLKKIAKGNSRCYIANNLMDPTIKLINLNLDPNTVITIECTSRAQLFEFNNNQNRVDIEFYPEEIISNTIKTHIKGKFVIYEGNREINIQNSFRDEQIQNTAQLYYILLVTIKFMSYEAKEVQYQKTCRVDKKISQILSPNHPNKIRVYYLEKEINQDSTLAEVGVPDFSELQIEELESTLILHIDNKIRTLSIDKDMTVQLLKEHLNLNQENYYLYQLIDQAQALSNDVVLKSLHNINNEIELIYKTGNNLIKIILVDSDDKEYTEYVKLNQQVKTFLQEFELKYNLKDAELFYEGETINPDKCFSDIQIAQNGKFEIFF